MSHISIRQIANLFESRLLRTLLEDEDFKESEMSQECKKAIATLRTFLASGCTKYKLITLHLVTYLDSQILQNIYEVKRLHIHTWLILSRAGALELLKFALLFDDHCLATRDDMLKSCVEIACSGDHLDIVDYFIEDRKLAMEDRYLQAAWQNDSVKVYTKYKVQENYRRACIEAYECNRIKIARAYAVSGEKWHMEPVNFRSIEQIEFYVEFCVNPNIKTIILRCNGINKTFDDVCILEYAAKNKLPVNWTSIFMWAVAEENAHALFIAADYADVADAMRSLSSQDANVAAEYMNSFLLPGSDKK